MLRMATRKRTKKGTTKATAWGANLRGWLAANRKDYEEGRDRGLPRNMRQLAQRLTGMGEPCKAPTVQDWYDGVSLPHARYVELLEDLFERPWRLLTREGGIQRPATAGRKRAAELLDRVPDDRVSFLLEQLRALGQEPRR